MVERKTGGLIALLDEQCAYKASDCKQLIASFKRQLTSSQSFEPASHALDVTFKVLHSAPPLRHSATPPRTSTLVTS
jgi:hypothetical protein